MEIFPLNNVYIVTPSSLFKRKHDFAAGIRQLIKMGFNVINPEFPSSFPSPQEKADQIHGAFTDTNVDMIMAARGGYSAMKALPYIDFKLIKKHPARIGRNKPDDHIK